MDQQDTAAAPPTWEERLAHLSTRGPAEIDVIIRDDEAEALVVRLGAELADARIAARTRLREARDGDRAPHDTLSSQIEADEAVTALREAFDVARTTADHKAITFRLRALPPTTYEALAGLHPPTPVQEEAGHLVNVDTYPPAVIAACSVFPLTYRAAFELIHGAPVEHLDEDDPRVWSLDPDVVERTHPPLNSGEAGLLFQSAREVNERPGSTILGKGWGSTSG